MPEPASGVSVEITTLVDLLRRQAQRYAQKTAFTFLVDGEHQEAALTYAELDCRARAIAGRLREIEAAGQRVLLFFPNSFDFLPAFFGCLYAGAIPVPAPLPYPRRAPTRALAILADAQPRAVLTHSSVLEATRDLLAGQRGDLAWLAADRIEERLADGWQAPRIDGSTLACLQYTSGSTRSPAGVMLSHANLLANLEMIEACFGNDNETRNVCWLPYYHDMGLVGGLLAPLHCGATTVLLSPTSFLQKPIRWLEAISRYGGTYSGGPNFAYDLCAAPSAPSNSQGLISAPGA